MEEMSCPRLSNHLRASKDLPNQSTKIATYATSLKNIGPEDPFPRATCSKHTQQQKYGDFFPILIQYLKLSIYLGYRQVFPTRTSTEFAAAQTLAPRCKEHDNILNLRLWCTTFLFDQPRAKPADMLSTGGPDQQKENIKCHEQQLDHEIKRTSGIQFSISPEVNKACLDLIFLWRDRNAHISFPVLC
jgi:hypothetical protein